MENNRVKQNKKANMTYTEFALIVIVIISIGLILFFSINDISGTKEAITKMAPELTYKFPAVFIHTFLMQEIDKDDIKNLGLDVNKKYFVKDILALGESDGLDLVKGKYRTNYLKISGELDSNQKSVHDIYKDYIGKNYYSQIDLIQIKEVSTIPDLESAIKDNNYFFYINNEKGGYILVYFL